MRLGWVLVLGCAGMACGQDAGSSIQAANDALHARDWAKAVKLLTPLAEASPRVAHVLYDLGSAQDALDQTTGAESSYRAAIDADGAYLEPRVAIGLLLARNGRMEDARTELTKAAAINSKDEEKPLRARALRALARIDEKTRPADAREELLAALAISDETTEDTLLAAELAEAAGNGQDAAEAAYRKVLEQEPNDPAATTSLGHLLKTEKKYEEAESLLVKGLGTHPGDEAMTLQLASVLAAEDKLAQAITLVEALHTADSKNAAVSRLLAGLYVDARDYKKAESMLAALSEQSTHDGELADLRAQALLHLHRPKEAEAVLTRVVAEKTSFTAMEGWGQAARDLAIAAQEDNDPDLVLQTLAERAKVFAPDAPIRFLSAISEDKLHHRQAAVQAYKDFLVAANGTMPNEEFEARHRLVALEHTK